MSTNEAETRARTMGWMPKDKFVAEGQPEDKWMSAEDYIARGESIMPILKANNKKLADRLSKTETELQSTKQLLTAAGEAIEELKAFRSTLAKDKVKEQKAQVLTALSEAKKSGDTDAEVKLTDQLTEVNAALKEAEKPAPTTKPASAPGPELSEASKSWMRDNPWFGQDQRKTGLAMGLSNEWKAQDKETGTQEFFDYVDQEINKIFDQNAERRGAASKVSSTNNSGGESEARRGNGGRTFADLPPEAKAACDRSGAKLVGKGLAYKTKEEWRQVYVEQYDWS
jgi:hypothetical protein